MVRRRTVEHPRVRDASRIESSAAVLLGRDVEEAAGKLGGDLLFRWNQGIDLACARRGMGLPGVASFPRRTTEGDAPSVTRAFRA